MRFPCVHAAATTPVQQLGVFLARLAQPYQPSPIPLSGRPAHRPFRGLLGVHSRCGLHTRAVTLVTAIRGLQTFRHLHACPGCFRLERIAGWALHPLEKRRLVTAHVETGHRILDPSPGEPRPCWSLRRSGSFLKSSHKHGRPIRRSWVGCGPTDLAVQPAFFQSNFRFRCSDPIIEGADHEVFFRVVLQDGSLREYENLRECGPARCSTPSRPL